MLRIAVILFSMVITSSAKVLELTDQFSNEVIEISKVVNSSYDEVPLWVLKLDGKWDMQLKLASSDEELDFQKNTGPMIENYEREHYKKYGARKPFPRLVLEVSDKKVTKEDIFRLLNKFALSPSIEPDAYLSESQEDDYFIALYFKGNCTSVLVMDNNKLWRFFIPPPTRLPAWFYSHHVRSAGHVLPEAVKQRFYTALFRLLSKIFSLA